MLHIEEKELHRLLEAEYHKGIIHGVKLMEQRMLTACENGTPINIEERAYFVKSDMDNLRDIFDDLEEEERYDNSARKRNA